jgi:hypothetical protein
MPCDTKIIQGRGLQLPKLTATKAARKGVEKLVQGK